MANKVFVVFRSGMSGGTATLSYRIGIKFIECGYKVLYVYESINDKDNYALFLKSGFEVIHKSNIKKHLDDDDVLLCLTYTLQEHVKLAQYLSNHSKKVIFLYPVSNGISGSEPSKLEKIRFLGKTITRKYFKSLEDKNLVFYPADSTATRYLQYYKCNGKKPLIFPLPIDVSDWNQSLIKNRFYSPKKTIISFLRADFPLKGYVFPLIDACSKLLDEKNEIKVVLIVSGECAFKVADKIKTTAHHNEFRLINGCPYEDLPIYLNNSFLNIGHGTSIIDASSFSLPSIVSVELSFDDECCGFFNTYRKITGYHQYAVGDYYSVIKQALNLDYESYSKISKETYDYVRLHFSASSFFVNLASLFEKSISKRIKYKCRHFFYFKTCIDNFIIRYILRRH